MRKIKVYKMNLLRNHDFTRAYDVIVSQLEGEEFEVEDVQTAYNSVCAHNEKLTKIKNGEAKHVLTQQVAELRDMRHQHVLSLRGRVVYSLKSPFAEERDAAQKLFRWLEKEEEFLRVCSIHIQAKSISNMTDTLGESLELQTALETLGLSALVDSIVQTSAQIDETNKQRTADQSAMKKETRELRNEAYAALQVLKVALEQAVALKKGDVDQSLFNINEMNRVIGTFAKKYDSDATRKRNAEEAAKAEAKAKAKAEAEASQNGQTSSAKLDGEVRSANVVTMGRKPVTTGRSGASGTKLLDGMDLQMEDAMTNVAMKSSDAMSDSVTSGVPLGEDVDKVTDVSAGAESTGEVASDALDNTLTDSETTQVHNGATMKDDDDVDHES